MSKTIQKQHALGRYIRSGQHKPRTSIDSNTYQYRRLVYNNIVDTLENAYPMTKDLIGSRNWNKIVKQFFENHECESNQIWQMPKEFLEYIKSNSMALINDYPHIENLMDYEWIEIEVFMMPDANIAPFITKGNFDTDKMVLNPEMSILPLNYPIFRRSPHEITPQDFSQYFVSIHRDFDSKKVFFNELGLVQVEILLFLFDRHARSIEIMEYLNAKDIYKNFSKAELDSFLTFCLNNGMILGFLKDNP